MIFFPSPHDNLTATMPAIVIHMGIPPIKMDFPDGYILNPSKRIVQILSYPSDEWMNCLFDQKNMLIFHRYVKLPEGAPHQDGYNRGW